MRGLPNQLMYYRFHLVSQTEYIQSILSMMTQKGSPQEALFNLLGRASYTQRFCKSVDLPGFPIPGPLKCELHEWRNLAPCCESIFFSTISSVLSSLQFTAVHTLRFLSYVPILLLLRFHICQKFVRQSCCYVKEEVFVY